MLKLIVFFFLVEFGSGQVLFQDDFSTNTQGGYSIVTLGNIAGPAQWDVINGQMAQTSNVYGSPNALWYGTLAHFGDSEWTNVRYSLDLMSSDDDGIGIVFRYVDENNYYQFRWDRQRKTCALEKIASGLSVAQTLSSVTSAYTPNTWYQVELICVDSLFTLTINGGDLPSSLKLSGKDSSFKKGALGLYSWGCQNSYFDNLQVAVAEKDTVAPLAISDLRAETANYGNGVIRLNWTATSDNGQIGIAAEYQIAYSTSPINTLADFLNAVLYPNALEPDSSASPQSLNLTNLAPGQAYYVRIRTRDDFYNWSGLSNPVSARSSENAGAKTYFKGQLHVHTLESGGSQYRDEVMAIYKSKGYDFVTISDHNVVTPVAQYNTPDFLTFPSAEVGTGSPHINALNFTGTYPSTPATGVQGRIDIALNGGAMPQINHPNYSGLRASSILPSRGVSLIEIINPLVGGLNYNLAVWDAILSTGRRMYGTGVDDSHGKSDIDKAWVMVYAKNLFLPEILKSLETGDFYSSTGATINAITIDGKALKVISEDGVNISFYGKTGTLLGSFDSSAARMPILQENLYVRAKVTNALGRLAFTQPFFYDTIATVANSLVPAKFFNPVNVHPNPFSQVTFFTLASRGEPGRMVLEIFDMRGRLINRLQSRFTTQTQKIAWNGRDQSGKPAPKGVFIYKLITGNNRFSGKIHKLK